MNNLQQQFIQFLLDNEALKFGSFQLKSGRISPYFFNLGVFKSGASLAELGRFYASILEQSGFKYDMLFGPAYKGIPLVSATTIALYHHYQKDVPYCFNRKEAKDHGDKGSLVGSELTGQVIMVDDVITAGTTVRETLGLLKNYKAQLAGIIIAFDRQERGEGSNSAVQEVAEKYNVPVQSIVTLQDVVDYLQAQSNMEGPLLEIKNYQLEYGN